MYDPIEANMAGGNRSIYEYKTLAHTDSIRLIKLLPGARGTPLACNIIDVRKGHQPNYEALSYAWGEPIFSHEIREVPSDTMLRLTVNLHDALQALRYEDTIRTIWADAIAINQLDLKEKGHQVALMGPIYRDAQRVVVWLGCPKAAPGRIAIVLKDLIEAVEKLERTKATCYLERAIVRLRALQFLQQPWYSRVWVVQEYVLAREMQFVAANEIIPKQLMITAFEALKGQYTDVLNGGSYRVDQETQYLLAAANRTSQLFAYRKRHHSLSARQSSSELSTSGLSLASCVTNLSRGRQCKDARDGLYAMLALAADDLGIRPDYSLSLSKVLNDFATRSLLAGDLSVLHASGIRPNHSTQLASFVPSIEDWSGMTLLLNTPELNLAAATHQSVSVKCESGGTVSIQGVQVDTITRSTAIDLSRRRENGENHVARVYHDFALWHNSPPNRHAVHFKPYENMSPDTIFARIITLDDNFSTIQTSEQGIPPEFKRATPEKWYSMAVEAATRQYLEHRMIFETQKGFLGFGPRWIQKDDLVVIFDGGATPFILRKHTKDDADGSPIWKLVGDCFLLGWMDGSYHGHTVVDEIPSKGKTKGEQAAREDEKDLVREKFVLC